MSNKAIVENFLSCYKNYDNQGMQRCLADEVQFSDYAFEDIHGKKVMAMWHWFCIPYGDRKNPIDVPEFSILEEGGDTIVAKYRVQYRYGKNERPVDYFIRSWFTIGNDKIVRQHDEFFSISEFEFAKMAFGFPTALLAFTPLLQMIVRKKAGEKLDQFMREKEK